MGGPGRDPADDARGASAVLGAVRVARTFNFMTTAEAAQFGIHDDDRRRHAGVPATGLGELSDVVKAVSIPVVAIGGVLITRVAAIMDANAAGVAVISAILGSPSPHEAASAIRRELQTYEHHFERQASRT